MSTFKFIDLFCGLGGFHLALNELGGQCVFASDIDKHCRDVYKLNHNLEPQGDITKIKPKDIPDHDILVGGFPCQPFSNSGKKLAFEDGRGLLFDFVVKIMEEKKPSIAILENVKHIKKVSDGQVYKHVYEKLQSIGYTVFDMVLSPHQIGIPQNRERVFFVVIKNELYTPSIQATILKRIQDKMKPLRPVSSLLMEIVEPSHNISDDLLKVLTAWDKVIKMLPIGERIGFPIRREYWTKTIVCTDSEYTKSVIIKNNNFYKKYKDFLDRWWVENETILSTRVIYSILEWQTGQIRPDESLFNHIIQVRQSGVRVRRGDIFPTLVAIVQTPVIGYLKRYLSVRECARLQSFPDTYQFPCSINQTMKQLGNSVNVDVVHLVASSIKETFDDRFPLNFSL